MSAGARRRRSWEADERRARMEHAARLVRRGADRGIVAAEFGVSRDVVRKWVERCQM